jgi:hypothetical protein
LLSLCTFGVYLVAIYVIKLKPRTTIPIFFVVTTIVLQMAYVAATYFQYGAGRAIITGVCAFLVLAGTVDFRKTRTSP